MAEKRKMYIKPRKKFIEKHLSKKKSIFSITENGLSMNYRGDPV